MLCSDLNRKESQERADTCIYTHVTDSLCRTAEADETVKQLHSNKIIIKRE